MYISLFYLDVPEHILLGLSLYTLCVQHAHGTIHPLILYSLSYKASLESQTCLHLHKWFLKYISSASCLPSWYSSCLHTHTHTHLCIHATA